jgi:hypothetical protein
LFRPVVGPFWIVVFFANEILWVLLSETYLNVTLLLLAFSSVGHIKNGVIFIEENTSEVPGGGTLLYS